MTDSDHTASLDDAQRFDAALARLEIALAASVQKIADMARRTGFDDGIAHAASSNSDANDPENKPPPQLHDELEAAKAREVALQAAVTAARVALNEAMEDIRTALGPL